MMKQDPSNAIRAMLRHNAICRMIIESNGGRVIKEIGDGLMARFDNVGTAFVCAVVVIKNFQKHGGTIRTKSSIAFGTVWEIKSPRGDRDVYGTPVHMSNRMGEIATSDTIVIGEADKAPLAEWIGNTGLEVRPAKKRLRNYPRTKAYKILVD